MDFTFDSIRLTASDLTEVSARHASAQEIYSPTAPREPTAQFGWRDRWWLNRRAAEQVIINYWFFTSAEEAYRAADLGRFRLSAQTVPTWGGRDSIYQPVSEIEHTLGAATWRAGANFLFTHESVVVLVSEIGGQVPVETTLHIARKVLEKVQGNLAKS